MAVDTFTDVAGTLLTAHTADDGGSWTLVLGNVLVITALGAARPGGGSDTRMYHSAVPPSPDYSVFGDIRATNVAGASAIGVAGRIEVGADTCYAFQKRSDEWRLYKMVAGVGTQIASSPETFVEGQVYAIELRMSGTTIEGYVDGALRCSGTDGDIAAAGRAGLYADGSGTINDSTTPSVDNYDTSFASTAPRARRAIMPRHTHAWL